MQEFAKFWESYSSVIITAVIILIALLVLVAAIKAFNGRTRGRRGQRLAISEYRELDPARRLVLVRRDGVEHLLLVGGNQDVVIETGIGAEEAADYGDDYVPQSRPSPQLVAENDSEPAPAPPPPRPPVFGDRSPNITPVRRDPPNLGAPDRDY